MANFLTMYATQSDATLNINALALPIPSYSSANQTISTLVNSGRSASSGRLFAQRVSDRDLSKIEIKWAYLTATDWSGVLQKIKSGDNGFYVWIKYFDMQSNGWIVREFYPSDRKARPFKLDPITKAPLSWVECKINFIDTGNTEIIL